MEEFYRKDAEKAAKKAKEERIKQSKPKKDGNVFEGWFNGETAFNFETAITANVSLKAKWSVGSIYHEAEDYSWGCSFDVCSTEYSEGDNVEVTLKVKSKNASGLALLADSSFGEQMICPFDGANNFASVTSWTEVTFIATIKADGKLQLKYGNINGDAATNNFTVYFKDISLIPHNPRSSMATRAPTDHQRSQFVLIPDRMKSLPHFRATH